MINTCVITPLIPIRLKLIWFLVVSYFTIGSFLFNFTLIIIMSKLSMWKKGWKCWQKFNTYTMLCCNRNYYDLKWGYQTSEKSYSQIWRLERVVYVGTMIHYVTKLKILNNEHCELFTLLKFGFYWRLREQLGDNVKN